MQTARHEPGAVDSQRFLLLDGLRGLAAICVMWFHFAQEKGSSWLIAALGRLAVDFFFLLSGFVICGAYEKKLLGGVTLGRFFKTRAIRLAPMLWLCAIVEQALIMWRASTHGTHLDYRGYTIATAAALLSVPNFFTTPRLYFDPLQARWSLFFEMLVNIVYAAIVRYLSNKILVAIIVVSAIILIGLDPLWGVHTNSLMLSAARTSSSFFLGVLIYRLYKAETLFEIKAPAWIIAAVVVLVFFFPENTSVEIGCSIIATFFILPLALIAACYVRLHGTPARLAYVLGELSYPVYLLHAPVQFLFLPILKKVGIVGNLASIIIAVLTCAIAWQAVRQFDEPVRQWLSRKGHAVKHTQSLKVDAT